MSALQTDILSLFSQERGRGQHEDKYSCVSGSSPIAISDTIQNLIYFFYEPNIRTKVMNIIQKQTCTIYKNCQLENWGTFYVNDKDTKSYLKFKNKMNKLFDQWYNKVFTLQQDFPPNIMFNVCLRYQISRVHFLSFVIEFRKTSPIIISFDSGSELYPEGEKTILPMVHKICTCFFKTKDQEVWKKHFGVCTNQLFRKKQYGIQFQGEREDGSSIADAFCQCWSLFFLWEWIRRSHEKDKHCRERFIHQWCELEPCHRGSFLLIHFVLPLLSNHRDIEKCFRQEYPSTLPLHRIYDHLWSTLWKKSIKSCNSQKCCL